MTLSAEKISLDGKSDSEAPSSTIIKPIKITREDLKTIGTAESLIDDYREVLHHAFRNLSSLDPNFALQAVKQDMEIEIKTGITLQSLPQPQGFDGLFPLDFKSDYLRNIPTQNHSEWGNQNKSIYPIPSPFNGNMIPSYSSGVPNNIQVPPNFLGVPMLINNSPQLITQPIPVKPLENGHAILTPTSNYQTSNKMKINGELMIPELRNSPPVKAYQTSGKHQSQSINYTSDQSPHTNYFRSLGESAVQKNNVIDAPLNLGKGMNNTIGASQNFLSGNFAKNLGIDQILNSDDSSMNYYNIFNSMEQGESIKRTIIPYNSDNFGEKSIKKNNIILTRTNNSEPAHN